MKEAELKQLTLANAASLIRSRELSPVELVEATLERIDGLNDSMHAFITVSAEQALERAKAAEREIVGGRQSAGRARSTNEFRRYWVFRYP